MRQVATIALTHDHHILMGRRRSSGRWTTPGGHLNEGENPREGAVRELFEETGIQASPTLFHHIETRIVTKPSGEKIKVHAFKIHLTKKIPTTMRIDPDEEVASWKWINLDGGLNHIAHNLHVPLGDNVLLDHMVKAKPTRKFRQNFWKSSRRFGVDR